jgi:hypothetical protein
MKRRNEYGKLENLMEESTSDTKAQLREWY